MKENETLAMEKNAENAEQTAEEIAEPEKEQEAVAPKMFTQEEVNKMMESRNARFSRKEARIRKEYEEKYKDLEDVLKAGTKKEDVTEIADTFRDFYKKNGVAVPEKSAAYSDADIAILAKAEAEDIIRGGLDDVVEETDRLARIGADKMTAREKAVFKALASHRKTAEMEKALSDIGVKEDVYNSREFKDFSAQFTDKVPVTERYKMYAKLTSKSTAEKIGSMQNGGQAEEKHFYTPEEVDRLTPKDYDNPKVMWDVRESMKRW